MTGFGFGDRALDRPFVKFESPSEEFPYGQLIGGGPALKQATWTEATANGSELRLKMMDLAGNCLYELAFQPLA